MIYQGTAISVTRHESGIAQLIFDLKDASVNKFNQLTLEELKEAIETLAISDVSGLVLRSAKKAFIVGADITEFTTSFKLPREELIAWCVEVNKIFNAVEDILIPTVAAINGIALGGGFELCLAADYRVASENAVMGFPEVKLGICPGFGGTVRLPRLIGADNANQWISSGQQVKAQQALQEGAIDAVVSADLLIEAAMDLVQQCIDGKLDYMAVREQKKSPLQLQGTEVMVAFETAKSLVAAQAGPNYPAPVRAVKAMQAAASLSREGALQAEHEAFADLAKTPVAENLVQMFLNDQWLNAEAKKLSGSARGVKSAAVLGAGIMGGGIAYQSALKGTAMIMKDIVKEGLDLGMHEAKKLLSKRVARGRMSSEKMVQTLSTITPTLDYQGFDSVDFVIEAVVENPDIKKVVLAEVEETLADTAIVTSNTSTISITLLATALKRPQNFCGMHFFNPVPVMPLVEVIRGEKSSDEAIATTVAYAKSLGKTPIVVNDCPGFLVNRVLFPYFGAFSQLIKDGADFVAIDRAMEKFGWPMGPAYLLDVIGLDTAVHCQKVMAQGFPDRMTAEYTSAIDLLFENNHLGQKTGSGFYSYESDKKGKPRKIYDEVIAANIATVQDDPKEFSDEEIVQRMMVTMCLEAVRCLEDGVISNPIEADMGVVLGLGFPAFRGGLLRYIDSFGVNKFCEIADQYQQLGPLYHPTVNMRQMAESGAKFYQ